MNHSMTATATVTDPVCGITIDPAQAAGSSSYNGETYHFCSRGCATKFEVAPAEYVRPAIVTASSPRTDGGHCCC